MEIIRELTLTYRGHELWTNHAQGIRNFMKLHEIPGATQTINPVRAVNFDSLNLMIGCAPFIIKRREGY